MSAALLTAIGNRLDGTEVLTGNALEAQNALLELLGRDRDGDTILGYSVLQGSFDESVEMPQVVFRQRGGVPHSLSGTDTAVIARPIIDIEVWTDTRSGTIHGDIHEYIEQLLDDRRGVAEPVTLSTGYYCETMETITDVSGPFANEARNASTTVRTYQAIVQRWQQGR